VYYGAVFEIKKEILAMTRWSKRNAESGAEGEGFQPSFLLPEPIGPTHTNLTGVGTWTYGWAKRLELGGIERIQADRAGYNLYSYQVVKWFVIGWFPVFPLGTYRVVKQKQGFWSLRLPSYLTARVEWDWVQVLRQYAIAYGWIIALLIYGLFDGH
jgi:hypothetical protein